VRHEVIGDFVVRVVKKNVQVFFTLFPK
jgi:hypothetical protein